MKKQCMKADREGSLDEVMERITGKSRRQAPVVRGGGV